MKFFVKHISCLRLSVTLRTYRSIVVPCPGIMFYRDAHGPVSPFAPFAPWLPLGLGASWRWLRCCWSTWIGTTWAASDPASACNAQSDWSIQLQGHLHLREKFCKWISSMCSTWKWQKKFSKWGKKLTFRILLLFMKEALAVFQLGTCGPVGWNYTNYATEMDTKFLRNKLIHNEFKLPCCDPLS